MHSVLDILELDSDGEYFIGIGGSFHLGIGGHFSIGWDWEEFQSKFNE